MAITFPVVKAIFDTLPTGYYLGRRITTILDENSSASYYDVANDKLIISAPMILDACASIDPKNSEEVIRGLLYHEVSHVILTGETPARYIDSKNRMPFNVLEDERIETILKDFYMNVNFRKNVFILNKYDGTAYPKTADQAFYYLVRYHIGNEEWIEKLFNLIDRYKNLNAASHRWDWEYYIDDCVSFYNEFIDWYNNQPAQDVPENGNSNKSNNSNGSNDNSDNTDNSENNGNDSMDDGSTEGDQEDTNESSDQNTTSGESNTSSENESQSQAQGDISSSSNNNNGISNDKASGDPEPTDDTSDSQDIYEKLANETKETTSDYEPQIEDAIHNVFNKYEDNKLQKDITRILEMSQKKKGMFEGAKHGYSGKIDPKAMMNRNSRDSFKWWTKHSVGGNINGIAKTHFNLFIDSSGSMDNNETEINTLLRALSKIKSSTFDFDVITIDTDITEWDQMRVYVADGGTDLDNRIAPVIRKHQKPNCNNFNIVVFDGEAHDPCDAADEPFRHFDTPNTILVVDSHNAKFISDISKARKVVIRGDYAKNFIGEILNLLEKVM